MVRFPHFSLVNNIPLYIDIDIAQLVYLSIDGNSDCFHVLVIVNSDGMSGVQISFLISLFLLLDIFSEVELLNFLVGKTTRPFRYDLNQIPYNIQL